VATATLTSTQVAPKPEGGSLKWLILLTVIIGTFLGRLDQTIVNLALPNIITDFHITVTDAGWIGTAYILANAVFVPIWGKLGDTIGRKKVYLIGFVGFIIGSVLAALAWNLPSLIVFRIIQAISGSADYPTAMAILTATFTNQKDRAQALGIWSSVFGAAAVFGPLIGGPLIDNFGWRSVFLINLPVGVIGTFMALTFITESKLPDRIVKFDWFGAGVLAITLASLVLVLDQGTSWGWLSGYSLTTYAVTLISGIIFVLIEQRHPEPIVDLKFFKNLVFVNTLVNNFIVFMGLMGSIFLVPIFAAPLGASLVGRAKPGLVIGISTLVAAFGLFLFSFLDVRSTALDIMIPLMVMAGGLGFGMAQRTNAVAQAVPASEIGVASSVLALVRNISGAFGIALFGSLLDWAEVKNVLHIDTLSHVYVHTATNIATFTGLIILKAEVDAYALIYEIAAGILFVGALFAFFIVVPDREVDSHAMMAE
jgi:MFS family permease